MQKIGVEACCVFVHPCELGACQH